MLVPVTIITYPFSSFKWKSLWDYNRLSGLKMKFENEGESIEFICISFILIHLYKLFSEWNRASVSEHWGEQVAGRVGYSSWDSCSGTDGGHCCRTNTGPGPPVRQRAEPAPAAPVQNQVLPKGIVIIWDSPLTSTYWSPYPISSVLKGGF